MGLGMMRIYSNSYAYVKSKKLSTPDYNMDVFICTLPTTHKPSVRAQTEAQWVMCFINIIAQSQMALSSVSTFQLNWYGDLVKPFLFLERKKILLLRTASCRQVNISELKSSYVYYLEKRSKLG